MFNSLKYVKQLEGVGLSRKQAETHIEIMTEIIETNLATTQNLKDTRMILQQDLKDARTEFKYELSELRNSVTKDMAELRTELKQDMAVLRTDLTELRGEMKLLESRLTIRLGTIVSVSIGAAVALSKLI